MANIHLIYSNSNKPLSSIIRWRTGSEFSHIGIILESDTLQIKPTSLVAHSALSVKGVRFTTVNTFINNATNHSIRRLNTPITQEQFNEMVYLSKLYEGLDYDLKGAIGLGVDEDWQEDDAFWCSEWVAFLLIKIGMNLKYLNDIHRISPKHNLEWPQTIVF